MPSSSIRSSAACRAGRFAWMSVMTATRSSIPQGSYPLTSTDSIDIHRSMTVDLELVPKQKRPPGEPCCDPVVYPDVERRQAQRMAQIAKALGDPIRLQLVDVLRKHAGKVCVCELIPLFDVGQPTVSHHLKVLRKAGIDMTDEMLELARRNQREAGIENAEFLRGTIEAVPLPDASVDVVISNCVINLSADKPAVFREAARVLRPGGRFAVSDIVADSEMDDATRADMEQWTGCISGALTESEYRDALLAAGFEQIEIDETHRVHPQAGSAMVRAGKGT